MAADKDTPEPKPDKPDTSGIQNWLAAHPDDPRAGAVREKLKGMGVVVPEGPPSGIRSTIEDYGQAAIQGAVLDPLEKVGQMAEHLPDWLGGGLARRAGSALSSIPFVSETMRKGEESGKRNPLTRIAGNILPWLAVPGFGEGRLAGLAADAGMGALGGVTQPLDPKDPNYWRDVGLQGAFGGVLGGGLGQVSRAAAANAQQEQRAALNVFQRIYNEMGLSGQAPRTITPQTAAQVRQTVGQRLGQIYQQMTFNPLDRAWRSQADAIYRRVFDGITDPALRQRWQSVFASEAARPAFLGEPGRVGAPLTGDKLHQLVSSLSGEASNFGQQAARGGADAKVWNDMSNGLRSIVQSIEGQIDRAALPAVGAARRGAARAYQLADTMVRAGNAGNRWIPNAGRIASTMEQKFGKTNYAGPRFGGVKRMLERERDAAERARAKPGIAARLGEHAVRIPGMIAGYEAGRAIGHPLAGALAGGELAHAAARVAPKAAARVGRYPAGAGAVAGQGVRIPEIVVTAPRYRPDEEK